MTDYIKNEIKETIKEQSNLKDNEYIISEIYKEAWKFVLTQLKKDFNADYYFLPFLFFTIYGKKNNDNVNKAIELLKQDGFYIDEKSNIQALRIKKETIIAFADSDTSTKMPITPFTEKQKRK